MMMGQYRKVAAYYRSNAIMVAVGDDFYFNEEDDWTANIKSFGALFKHINSHPEKFAAQVSNFYMMNLKKNLNKNCSRPVLGEGRLPRTGPTETRFLTPPPLKF
jgi:hypothetical protein